MTENYQKHTDAPDTIKSNPTQALHELFNLQQTNPAEFKQEVALINRTTDLSFLANGKHDMEIVGFEHTNQAQAGGVNRLVLQDRNDHSLMRTNFTAEGKQLHDASITPVRDAAPGRGSGDGMPPMGNFHQSPNSVDINYPNGRQVHVDVVNHTPMRFTENGHTYERQMINGQPSHTWSDSQDPNRQINMELNFDKNTGRLDLRQGDANGNVLGSTTYNLDGSKVDIQGDYRDRSQRTEIQRINTPDGRVIMPDPPDRMHPEGISGFTDERNVHWTNTGAGFSAPAHNLRRDVQPMNGGRIGIVEKNGSLASYNPDGTINYGAGPGSSSGTAPGRRF